MTFKELPSPPKSFLKILGPSFILLGLGLGSGEIILWPYLVSNFGLGIIWAAVLGITIQFFWNMEIERYALIMGQSVFVGFKKLFKFLPFWFILSTFLGFGWPGIIASSAKILAQFFRIERFDYLAIFLLLIIGVILTLGPSLYKTVERFQKIIIGFGVPFIFLLTLLLAKSADWSALFNGLIGRGDNYFFLPAGIPLLTFLGALAFAGAGGNLNLSQSFYIKEKGYGMGKYSGKISSLITGREEKIKLEGETFKVNPDNLKKFQQWWKAVNLEHATIFWLTGAFTILLLALLAYATTFGASGNLAGIDFIINESKVIGNSLGNILGLGFLLGTGIMLFGTQFTVLDSTSRIMTENVLLAINKTNNVRVPIIYYSVLWLQIIFGIIVFLIGFSEPLRLITIGAVINAVAMFAGIGLTLFLNLRSLPRELQPSLIRRIILSGSFLFFGVFSAITLVANLPKIIH